MERVEQLKSIKVEYCTIFSVLRNLTLDFRCHTTIHKIRMRITEVVRKIAQKCEEHIYTESLGIKKNQSGRL